MNILWQNQHYPDVVKGGGGAINTGYIVRSLLAQGHNAVILAQASEGHSVEKEQVDGTSVIRAPKPELPSKIWPLWPFLESYYLNASIKEIASSFDAFVCIDAPHALAVRRLFRTGRLCIESKVQCVATQLQCGPWPTRHLFHSAKRS